MLEAGPDNMMDFRMQTKGYLSDQSVESHVSKAPYGSTEEIGAVVAGLRTGNISLTSEQAINTHLFPFSFDQLGLLHIFFNPLEEATNEVEEWPAAEKQLKAMAKLVGDHSYKERLLEKGMQTATREERYTIHAYEGHILDWRWEHLEEVLAQMVFVIPILVTYFKADLFTEEGSLIKTVMEALACGFLPLFCEMMLVVCGAIGREARWLEGCFCHEEVLTGHDTYRKRSRAMRDSAPAIDS
jgi:hypothetical protein